MKMPPELRQMLDDAIAGKHEWTEKEKALYARVIQTLGPDKAKELMAIIPPPSN